MRLIDADDLNTHKFLTPQVKVIGGKRNGKIREQIVEAYQKGWNDCIDAIVDNAPTVEDRTREVLSLQETIRKLTKERPHGEWITSKIDGEKYNCSECGGSCWYYDYQGDVSKSNFCPNCGADMRGDANGR